MEKSSQSAAANDRPASARPALAAVLLQRQPRLWSRFLAIYARLQRLPRGWRRRIARKAAVSLAGAALLLALGRAPAGVGVVHGGNIDVDGVGCTLVDAILSAENDTSYGDCQPGSGADTITLMADITLTESYGYYDESYTGTPLITTQITIQGGDHTIARDPDNPDRFRLFTVGSSGDLTLNNVTLSGGYAYSQYEGPYYTYYYGDGGAVFSEGALTITNSTLSNNRASDEGGAVDSDGGSFELTNSTVSGNSADDGGGLHIDNMDTIITGSTISDNVARDEGGGIAIDSVPTVTIIDTIVEYNRAENGDGGGIEGDSDALYIQNSVIRGNYADEDGGGLWLANEATISGTTIHNNTSTDDGGGVFFFYTYGQFNIFSSTISNNNADENGGGVYFRNGQMNIVNSTISHNDADDDGGGVFIRYGQATIVNSTISGNTAVYGGGGVRQQSNGAAATIINSTITRNRADAHGGGIDVMSGELTLERSIISGNLSPSASEIDIHDNTIYPPVLYVDAYNIFGHSGVTDNEAFDNFGIGGSDIVATSDSTTPYALDEILRPTLANNGGPTRTHGLVEGSPALDLAPSADCAVGSPADGVDQRGEPRNQTADGNITAYECDTGAFEGFVTGELFLSAETPGTTGDGINFGREDILRWDGSDWSLFFDGSAAGLKSGNKAHDINDMHVNGEDDIYLTFFQNKIVTANIGRVFGHDVVHYNGSGFSLFFDGSQVGLTTASEKLDGFHIVEDDSTLPGGGSCDVYLLVSTFGTGKVPAAAGGMLKFQGEDVLGFCAINTGDVTAGFWHMVLDGSAEGMPKNSTFSLSANDDASLLYFTTKASFNVPPAVGGHSMIYAYDRASGDFSGPLFDAPANGLPSKVNGLHVAGSLP